MCSASSEKINTIYEAWSFFAMMWVTGSAFSDDKTLVCDGFVGRIDHGKALRDNLTVWARPGIAVAIFEPYLHNLGCATGHHPFFMPRPSTNLVLVHSDLSRYFKETTACKNEVFLFQKQLDVKVTSCTFTTRYRAYRLCSGTGSFQRCQGERSFKVSSLPHRVTST